MRRSSLNSSVLACCLLVFAAQYAHARITSALASVPSISSGRYVPSAAAVKMVSLGYDDVLADLYWLSFVQYVGDSTARKTDGFAAAQKQIELIIELDPRFVQAYYFAAFIIGSEMKQPRVAAELIDRGILANQDNWCLPFIAGINQYLYGQNEVAAARYYRMAARFPDAPDWLLRQASILESKIPSMIKEINIWDSIYNSNKDSVTRQRAKEKLENLWAHVYRVSPSGAIRQRACKILHDLRYDKTSKPLVTE